MNKQFRQLDVNQDARLELNEFLAREGERELLRRDFHLFDLDSSGTLTRQEFGSVWGLVAPAMRERLPDPFERLVREAVVALDQSYDHWNQRPGEMVNAHTFVANFIGSISYGGKRYVTGRIIRQADGNSDGKMSRAEAENFLCQQLGLRLYTGPPLREDSGRVLRFDRFISVDIDQDMQLSWREFQPRWWSPETARRDFGFMDRDQNELVSYAEYAHHSSPNFFDPIEWFRRADTDLDAKLDEQEIGAAASPERQHLAASTMRAFDGDNDDRISLQEYRLSMLGNHNYTWDAKPLDKNRDGKLSYSEFTFHQFDLFQLQRSYYFHRLDADQNGELAPSEFEFAARMPFAIHRCAADGKLSRQIYRDIEHPTCGSVSVSPDGTQILFDRLLPNDTQTEKADGRIVVMDAEGGNVRDLCDGQHPSWSANSLQFACSKKQDRSVWIMESDGLSGKPIAEGRTPKWSPDGKWIAYQLNNGLWLHELATGKQSQLVSREDHRYRDLGEDIVWNPSSDHLAILARTDITTDLVIFTLELEDASKPSGKPRLQHSFSGTCQDSFHWNVDHEIVVGIQEPDQQVFQLFGIAPFGPAKSTRKQSFDDRRDWNSACLTPDKNWYIAVSQN
ncbi:MAG: DPP IV N-terminal domain-containing protein [Rubripirellula sp.]